MSAFLGVTLFLCGNYRRIADATQEMKENKAQAERLEEQRRKEAESRREQQKRGGDTTEHNTINDTITRHTPHHSPHQASPQLAGFTQTYSRKEEKGGRCRTRTPIHSSRPRS